MPDLQICWGRQCGKTYTRMAILREAAMSGKYPQLLGPCYNAVVSSDLWYIQGFIKYNEDRLIAIFPERRERKTELYHLKVMASQNFVDELHSGLYTNQYREMVDTLLRNAGAELWPDFSKDQLETNWAIIRSPRVGAYVIRAVDI